MISPGGRPRTTRGGELGSTFACGMAGRIVVATGGWSVLSCATRWRSSSAVGSRRCHSPRWMSIPTSRAAGGASSSSSPPPWDLGWRGRRARQHDELDSLQTSDVRGEQRARLAGLAVLRRRGRMGRRPRRRQVCGRPASRCVARRTEPTRSPTRSRPPCERRQRAPASAETSRLVRPNPHRGTRVRASAVRPASAKATRQRRRPRQGRGSHASE